MELTFYNLIMAYVIMSIITFLAYWVDKRSAQKRQWRTPEKTLHILSLACGWPGALIAQKYLRHKTKKQPFRTLFWLTVAFNIALVGYLLFFK